MTPKTKIICGCVLLLPFVALNATEIKQTTSGDCSSAVSAGGNVNYSKKVNNSHRTTVIHKMVVNNYSVPKK